MLVLSRKLNESIVINEAINVTVLDTIWNQAYHRYSSIRVPQIAASIAPFLPADESRLPAFSLRTRICLQIGPQSLNDPQDLWLQDSQR